MNTPSPDSPPHYEAPLVEPIPHTAEGTTPESLDTERILRDTGAITVPGAGTAEPAGQALERETRPGPLNILSVVAVILALALSPFALIFGYIAVGQVRRAHQRGEGLAWCAVALGWLWLVGYSIAGAIAASLWFQLA